MSQAHSRGEYLGGLGRPSLTAAQKIDQAVNLLMPGARRKALAALVDSRVHWETVRAWRDGRNRPPQWALDLINAKLMAHGARYLELANTPAPAFNRKGAIENLNRYRAAQAAKRNATSEKA